MAHCEAEALALRFVAGDLNGPEGDSYARHLADCTACREVTKAGLAWADAMIFHMAETSPPRRVLRRLEAQVGEARYRRWASSWVALAAGSTLLLGFGLGHVLVGPGRAARPRGTSTAVVAALKESYGRTGGQLVVWRSSGRIAITAPHLPPPPPHQVYEVWSINGVGPRPLGPIHWKGGYGWFTGRGQLAAGDQVVVCTEAPSWEGEWIGPIVMSATVPNT